MGGFSIECYCGRWYLSRPALRDHCRTTGCVYRDEVGGVPRSEVMFQSAVSGLWYDHPGAAGDIIAIKISGRHYVVYPTVSEYHCYKCHHNNVDENGRCLELRHFCREDCCEAKPCFCHCKFPEPPHVHRFQAWTGTENLLCWCGAVIEFQKKEDKTILIGVESKPQTGINK